MRALCLVIIALVAGCTTPEPERRDVVTSTVQTSASPTSSPAPALRERDYLDALTIAQVPISRTGEAEIRIGRGVCAEVSKGADPESLADDLRRAVPVWTSDNVTAVIRSALSTLC